MDPISFQEGGNVLIEAIRFIIYLVFIEVITDLIRIRSGKLSIRYRYGASVYVVLSRKRPNRIIDIC